MSVNYQPSQYHSVTPYILLADVQGLIDFLGAAFNAEVVEKIATPDGTIMHAEVKIGDSIIMMGQPSPEFELSKSLIYVYTEDVNATYKQALEAGGTSMEEPKDQFYGDRIAAVKDPFGKLWWIATHIEDVSSEELDKRSKEEFEKRAQES